jgi:mono/diheme cytochrome c family protein
VGAAADAGGASQEGKVMKASVTFGVIAGTVFTGGVLAALAAEPATTATAAVKAEPTLQERRAARGKELVFSIGCNDCHTPKKMGPKGPELDETRILSGHREEVVLPTPPALPPGPWGIVTTHELTAWSGPWGISYAPNLTPDEDTGLGIWTEDMFIGALRTGRHMGQSRPILPPMPWDVYGRLPDEDLKSIYAYLRALPPVKNRVPQPVIAGEE